MIRIRKIAYPKRTKKIPYDVHIVTLDLNRNKQADLLILQNISLPLVDWRESEYIISINFIRENILISIKINRKIKQNNYRIIRM